MFKKKKVDIQPLKDELAQYVKQEVDARLKSEFIMGEPEVLLLKATISPIYKDESRYGYNEYVEEGRWYAKIDGTRQMILGANDPEKMSMNQNVYKGFATAAAAEKAAREWLESRPIVRVRA